MRERSWWRRRGRRGEKARWDVERGQPGWPFIPFLCAVSLFHGASVLRRRDKQASTLHMIVPSQSAAKPNQPRPNPESRQCPEETCRIWEGHFHFERMIATEASTPIVIGYVNGEQSITAL